MSVMKAAIYARVSTGDQNCHMQVAELRQYCATRGWDIHGEYTWILGCIAMGYVRFTRWTVSEFFWRHNEDC